MASIFTKQSNKNIINAKLEWIYWIYFYQGFLPLSLLSIVQAHVMCQKKIMECLEKTAIAQQLMVH